MATTRNTTPDAATQEPTAEQLAADQAAELERLKEQNEALQAENADLRATTPETAVPKRYAKAAGPPFAVLWAKVSLADLPTGTDGPRFVVPEGRKSVNGFTTVTRGELIAGANAEGVAHVAELLTLGAVRPAA